VRDRGTMSAIMTLDMSRRSGLIGHINGTVCGMMRRDVRVYTSLSELLARVQVRSFQ
jgi:hypothetical protein